MLLFTCSSWTLGNRNCTFVKFCIYIVATEELQKYRSHMHSYIWKIPEYEIGLEKFFLNNELLYFLPKIKIYLWTFAFVMGYQYCQNLWAKKTKQQSDVASVKTLLLIISLFESQKHLFQFPYLKIVFSDQLCFSSVVSISKCLYLSFENVLWKLLFIEITVIEPNISAEECKSCSLALTPMCINMYMLPSLNTTLTCPWHFVLLWPFSTVQL